MTFYIFHSDADVNAVDGDVNVDADANDGGINADINVDANADVDAEDGGVHSVAMPKYPKKCQIRLKMLNYANMPKKYAELQKC